MTTYKKAPAFRRGFLRNIELFGMCEIIHKNIINDYKYIRQKSFHH